MIIGIIGTGYVGLVSGTCFAEMGNEVFCIDNDAEKIANLKKGVLPIYEPGLEDLVKRNGKEGRLHFETSLAKSIAKMQVIFIAVGTPTCDDGSADLQYVEAVAKEIALLIEKYTIIVNKSTVPVGTGERIEKIIDEVLTKRKKKIDFDVVSNPEFLKEGAAVEDFLRPDRIILGSNSKRARETMQDLYRPFMRNEHPIIIMDRTSSELTKYAANGLLATKISFMNELAILAEKIGADITSVRRGIGSDRRIGLDFLYPGPGYGGSCFPKDVKAIINTGKVNKQDLKILAAVHEVNERQKEWLPKQIFTWFKKADKLKVAIWGLAFKARTDDIRESPALTLIERLLDAGFEINVYDPEAMENTQKIYHDKLCYFDSAYLALEGCNCLAIVTEWSSFRNPDFAKVKELLKEPVIFDSRNLFTLEQMKSEKINYISMGRKKVIL